LAWAGTIVILALVSQALAAAAADGILRQLQSGAGVAASERNATDLALLAGFYEERQMRPLWITERAASGRARTLARILQAADRDGLNPDDYGATAIGQLLDATEPDALAELELRLSLGLIQFASDLASGRLEPSEVDPELFVYPQDVDHAAVIRAAADAEDLETFVAGFGPAQDE
jgi:murein L,D-transpeptidase YcbB/YkuD